MANCPTCEAEVTGADDAHYTENPDHEKPAEEGGEASGGTAEGGEAGGEAGGQPGSAAEDTGDKDETGAM